VLPELKVGDVPPFSPRRGRRVTVAAGAHLLIYPKSASGSSPG